MELTVLLIGIVTTGLGFLIWNSPELGEKIIWYIVLILVIVGVGYFQFNAGFNEGVDKSAELLTKKVFSIKNDSLLEVQNIIKAYQLENEIKEGLRDYSSNFKKNRWIFIVCAVICACLLTFARLKKAHDKEAQQCPPLTPRNED